MSDMKIGAISPWFGSKRTLAPTIIRELGEHRCYWEPFCGSMAVLLAKPACRMETVNDLHGDLINLARTMQHPTAGLELYRMLRRAWMHEAEFQLMADRYRTRGRMPAFDEPDIERAYEFFILSWMGRNGVQGTQSYNQGYSVRYTKNGGHGATRFLSVVDSIPAFRRRLRGVAILNKDGFEIISKIEDAEGVAIYVDPPYLVKGAKYVHDFTAAKHRALACLLYRFKKTRVVVSYYDHPTLDELYPDWTKIDCSMVKALVNAGMRDQTGPTVAPEVLLINGPDNYGALL